MSNETELLCVIYMAISVFLTVVDWRLVVVDRRSLPLYTLRTDTKSTHLWFIIFLLAISASNGIMLVAEQYDLSFWLSTVVVVAELVCINDGLKRK